MPLQPSWNRELASERLVGHNQYNALFPRRGMFCFFYTIDRGLDRYETGRGRWWSLNDDDGQSGWLGSNYRDCLYMVAIVRSPCNFCIRSTGQSIVFSLKHINYLFSWNQPMKINNLSVIDFFMFSGVWEVVIWRNDRIWSWPHFVGYTDITRFDGLSSW